MSDLLDRLPEEKYKLLYAQTFDPSHYGFPEIYYKIMETDATRVNAFKDAFAKYKYLKNKTVCEAGIGRLALTMHYLPHVKKAYLIENNPNIIDGIKKTLVKNGWSKKTELIVGDAMKVELPEKVDFLIGELMSIYCANEYQVQIFKHLRQFLKPKGKLFPERIVNLVQLGRVVYDNDYKHYPIFFTRHLPEMISSQEVVNTIDLYKASRFKITREIKLKAIMSGTLNCAYMSSFVQLAEGINFTGTDSLMPPTVIRLKKPVKVKAGQTIKLKVTFEYGTNLDQAVFEVIR